MFSREKLVRMAEEHWGVDVPSERNWEKTVGYAQLVIKEYERIRAIENTRMGCLMNGGHEFVVDQQCGWSDVEMSSGSTVLRGWKGSGKCRNCDAVLVVQYPKEEM